MPQPKIVRWTQGLVPTEQEAEAKLRAEGYEAFRWYDVPGQAYPAHRHPVDECIWVLKGAMTLQVDQEVFDLKEGDRLYLPARVLHTAQVPALAGVTYLVGQLTSK